MKIRLSSIAFDFTPAEVTALVAQAGIAAVEGRTKRQTIRNLLECELASLIDEYTNCRRCRLCGCTDRHGCAEGCEWVEADLCSVCSEALIEEEAASA